MKKAEPSAKFAGPGGIRSTETLRISLPSRFIYIKPLRAFVTQTATLAGFSEEKVEEIGLVLTEVFNNAIEYGSETPSNSVAVVCQLHPDRMTLAVKDEGKKTVDFAPLLKRADLPKPVDDLDQRGRGLFLIKRLTDDLVIESVPGQGTEVTVTKLK